MRNKYLDLNYLVKLEALLVERGPTRAAERLHLTQPAVSNALAELREHFGDALLVPLGGAEGGVDGLCGEIDERPTCT